MATDAGLFEVFDALVENVKLVIQMAQEIQDPYLINQETTELCEIFSTFSTSLAQMTNQGSIMVSLPQGVKQEKPKSITGVIDIDSVNAFNFKVEQYFSLTNIVDAN